MRRPINWIVVLISICFLFANTTLTGRGREGDHSVPGDRPSDAEDLFARTLADVGTAYFAEPAVVVTLDDEFPESTGLRASVALAPMGYDRSAAPARLRAAHASGSNRADEDDLFGFVEALEDEHPVAIHLR